MTQKYMNDKKLQEVANALSKEIFGKSYNYPISFVDPTFVDTSRFLPYAERPVGNEYECEIEISKKMRHATPRQFIYSLLSCLKEFYIWWLGHENAERITISKEKVEQFITYYESL